MAQLLVANRRGDWATPSLLLAVLLSAAACGSPLRGGQITPLTTGSKFQKQISSNDRHVYQVSLAARQFARLEIDHQGTDLIVATFDPGDHEIVRQSHRRPGIKPLSLITAGPGAYRIEISSPEKSVSAGSYAIMAVEIRSSTPRDQQIVAAEREMAAAESLKIEGSEDSLRKAIVKYQEARRTWKSCGELKGEIDALTAMGEISFLLSEFAQARGYYLEARDKNQQIDDPVREVEVLNRLSECEISSCRSDESLKYAENALELSGKHGYRRGQAHASNNLGEYYYWMGKTQTALSHYRRALDLWIELGDRRGEAQSRNNIGFISSDLGETGEAFAAYHEALSIWESLGEEREQAITICSLGRLHSRIGESQEALNLMTRAAKLIEPTGDKLWQAATFTGLAFVYDKTGEKQLAINYYEQALTLFKKINSCSGMSITLEDLGTTHFSRGEIEEALDHYHEALAIARKEDDRRTQAYLRRDIGLVYHEVGRRTEALKSYQQSLSFYRQEKDGFGEAFTLNLIGRIYHDQGRPAKALDCFERALSIDQNSRNTSGESLTLYNLARTKYRLGRLDQARSDLEASIGLVEDLRNQIKAHDLRASYLGSVHDRYDLYIDLLMRMDRKTPGKGLDAAALQASEQSRARSTLELLSEAQADVRQGDNPALIEKSRSLRQRINLKEDYKLGLIRQGGSTDEISGIAGEIEILIGELRQVEAEIKQKSPRYAALTQPQPLDLKGIQRLLDDDTLLLEYKLAQDGSYLWVVSSQKFTVHSLPESTQIEKAALSVYRSISRTHTGNGKSENDHDREYWRHASELSRMIARPLLEHTGYKRLIIVPDGILQYIPFQALPQPAHVKPEVAKKDDWRPLVLDYEIVNLPSASTLAILRRDAAQRTAPSKIIAALADPVFEQTDWRLEKIKSPAENTTIRSTLSNRTAGSGGPVILADLLSTRNQRRPSKPLPSKQTAKRLDLYRLRWTIDEAKAIEAVTSPADRLIALGFEANRKLATSPELTDYRIIHLATHGLLDSQRPELSAIIFSLFDRDGQQQEGYLRLHDIYNLSLSADLVVLSACETALGQEIKGEGLIGLTRGFMYAGAARVMSSLWKVEDESTAELMKHFYRSLLKDKLKPSAALRQAQIELWREAEMRSPYHWAGFIIQGDWR